MTPMKPLDPLRQSSIARFDSCALSLKLEVRSPERQPSVFAARGTLFHTWVARALAIMREHGEEQFPVDMGLELLTKVLAQRDIPDDEVVHIPMSQAEWLRVLVTKWCEGVRMRSARIIAIEERLHLTLQVPDDDGGTYPRTITGRPDVLVADPPDGVVVCDWKTGFAPPAESRHNGDGDRLSDHGYVQQIVYGLLVLGNIPTVERVTLREYYVLFGEFRESTIWRSQLERYQDLVAARVAEIDAAFKAGPRSKRWLPTAGTHCGFCPAPRKCPLKRWHGIPTTEEEAVRLAREWIVAGEVRKERLPLLKGWVDARGPVPIDHAKGRRVVGWTQNKTGDGRSFKIYEPADAPEQPFAADLEMP